jgi:hypothetical protein
VHPSGAKDDEFGNVKAEVRTKGVCKIHDSPPCKALKI